MSHGQLVPLIAQIENTYVIPLERRRNVRRIRSWQYAGRGAGGGMDVQGGIFTSSKQIENP